MPTPCKLRTETGPSPLCTHECPLEQFEDVFQYARVEKPSDIPPFNPRTVDVVIMDMNFGMPNLGHDSLLNVVRAAVCDFADELRNANMSVRVLSYDLRRSVIVPEQPGPRFLLYLGTGGPGHLDPRRNTGDDEYCQGVRESVAWEAPLFELFESILHNKNAAMLGICHTFGLMCRWSGAAHPVLRGAEKGGKSAGVLENLLTNEALEHPWFSQFSSRLANGRRLRILDSRFFDLIPDEGPLPRGFVAIGHETRGVHGPRGDSITMIEFRRNPGEVIPGMFAVNHHPEIMDRSRQLSLLHQKRSNNHVTEEWFAERLKVLTTQYSGEDSDRMVSLTSWYTLVAPIRYHLARILSGRAAEAGRELNLPSSLVFHSHSVPAAC